MSQFNLFHLPAELVLQVVEYLPAADLASFLRTSKTSWQFAIKTAEKFPIRKILIQFKQASSQSSGTSTTNATPPSATRP
jgi:hypothetical protein